MRVEFLAGRVDRDDASPSFSRTALSEKKPTVKARSPEKNKPEEKDPDKSPTKKQEGSSTCSPEAGEGKAPGFALAWIGGWALFPAWARGPQTGSLAS